MDRRPAARTRGGRRGIPFPTRPDTRLAHRRRGGGVASRHRHGGAIAGLARAIQAGDADAALADARAGGLERGVAPTRRRPIRRRPRGSAPIRDLRRRERPRRDRGGTGRGRARPRSPRWGASASSVRHRRGPGGRLATWTAHIERWLEIEVEGFRHGRDWYVGRPLIVTENDYALDLFNGDIGVVVKGADPADWWRPSSVAAPSLTVSTDPAGRGGHRLRHDRAQEPGLPVRGGGVPAAGPRLPRPDPRAALHGRHPGPGTAHPRRAPRRRSAPPSGGRSPGPRGSGRPSGASRADPVALRLTATGPSLAHPRDVSCCLGSPAGENPWSHG